MRLLLQSYLNVVSASVPGAVGGLLWPARTSAES
jgi:hypothetical protein